MPLDPGDFILCTCGRYARHMFSVGWVWRPPGRRCPVAISPRYFACPRCRVLHDQQMERIGIGVRYTAADLWDDANNDPEERRRLEALEDVKGDRE